MLTTQQVVTALTSSAANLVLGQNPNRVRIFFSAPSSGIFLVGVIKPTGTNTPGLALTTSSPPLRIDRADIGSIICDEWWVWPTSAGQTMSVLEVSEGRDF